MSERYAIYFAPAAESPLWAFGTHWLGRDPETGADLPRPDVDGMDDSELAAATASPRRYGFHGTLKPPFRLREGRSPGEVYDAVAAFASQRSAFELSGLKLAALGGFLALVPDKADRNLAALAGDCVRTFDAFRAPPSQDELARRRTHGLTDRQEAYLEQWGYPYVLDEFRFHLTLTERLDRATADTLLPQLRAATDHLTGRPVPVDQLALFHEPEPGADFRLIARFSLSNAAA